MRLRVFINHRAIREYIARYHEGDGLMDKLLSIDEFEKRAQLFESRVHVDDDQRDILLKEAAEFEGFSLLKIEKDFLTFIKSSPSILKFFEELAKESVTFEMIERADTYAEYENHLNVLKILHERYVSLLDEKGYVDGVNAPSLFRINRSYLATFEAIHLYFEGYLSRYEVKMLQEATQVCETYVHIATSPFTQKMHTRFDGFELAPNRRYVLNLTQKSIVSDEPLTFAYPVALHAAPTRLHQAAAVKKLLYDFVTLNRLEAKKIAVILPDEAFVSMLSLYDTEKNYNYAMGEPFTSQRVFRQLHALYELRQETSIENTLRVERLGLETSRYEKEWPQVLPFETVMSELALWADAISDEQARHLYLEKLHGMKKIKKELEIYSFKELMHLFLNRLQGVSVDLAGGGNITVMGALESRGVAFDGVIVCDFNEGFVPKENKKDLYLNSAVRHHAGLPTRGDRQNLQLDLYHNLFSKSIRSAVVYVEDEENLPSTFIKQLKLEATPRTLGDELIPLLYRKGVRKVVADERIEREIQLSETPLSATKLKDYLACKRRYFYKYIEKLRDFEIPQEGHENYVMGTILHEALNNLYRDTSSFTDREALKNSLEMEVKKLIKDDLLLQFEGDIWLKRLDVFCDAEIARFGQGYRVESCEERMSGSFEGIVLEGVIDRIDRREGRYSVIDYKSGSFPAITKPDYEKTKDFQLLFYHLLASVLGEVEEAFYYDLKTGRTVKELFIEEKKEFLRRRLAEYGQKRQNFTLTEEKSECLYCPYKIICGRE